MRKIGWLLIAALFMMAVVGCAWMKRTTRQRQVASVLTYLFPGTEQIPPISDQVAEIKVPFRIGVAFVPDNTDQQFRLPESDRINLAAKVSEAFANYPFISDIVAVPSMYLESGGGFANLDRIAALLRLDVIALISFDQVQNSGATGWSFLYWTGVGVYVIKGDEYDILTAVETAVFHIKSQRLLMRAAGISDIKNRATMVGFSESARKGRTRGFDEAIAEMIGKLHIEVKHFRERAPKDPTIRLILPPGYNPNAVNSGSQ
jgi:rhombotail lipoprotein